MWDSECCCAKWLRRVVQSEVESGEGEITPLARTAINPLKGWLYRGPGFKSRRPAVRRNPTRFPNRFVLVVTGKEVAILISQNVISKIERGGATKPPMAFTEHGALMVASVLNSARAISDK